MPINQGNMPRGDFAPKKFSKGPGIRVSGDPELFIAKVEKSGTRNRKHIIPVCGLVGGTKENPIPIPGCGSKGFMMQEDGVALEFNFPPAEDSAHFAHYVDAALQGLSHYLKEKSLDIVPNKCAHEFSVEDLDSPQASIVGCSPDIDAYTREQRTGMNTGMFGRERFTAGHFHISFPNPHNIPTHIVARFLDLHMTLPYLALDKQGNRRKHYGLAGLYRDTKYPDGSTGIEYRTMSNFWIFNPDYRIFLSQAIISIISDMNRDIDATAKLFDLTPWGDVKRAIDNENIVEAKKLHAEAAQFAGFIYGRKYLSFQEAVK